VDQTAVCIRGIVLPDGEQRSFWIVDGRLRTEPVGAVRTTIDGGWLLPGLVDVHTHPGTEQPGDRFEDAVLRRHLLAHRDAGILTIRTPGTASRLPEWVHDDPELPRSLATGLSVNHPYRWRS
jgi:imidazolonepropionase-like amidohydrolase